MEVTRRRSPYKGLEPFDEDDAAFFFGRERDTRIIVANLFAAPLTLFYGASGVGKSSVLGAGVLHELRRRDDVLVFTFNTWQGDSLQGLKAAVCTAAAGASRVITPPPDSLSLARYLDETAKALNRRMMIILDQFEEYFLYHSPDDAFAAEFPAAVARHDPPISFLISIREDALARLDLFEARIPGLYDNLLRLEHLDYHAASQAILRPVEQYNEMVGPGESIRVDPALVDAVIEQVRTGEVVIGESGRGQSSESPGDKVEIETPYLQLVLLRLWDEEMHAGTRRLRLETLQSLGGARHIVETHLDIAMNSLKPPERDIAASAFRYLVSRSGTKYAYSAADLADQTEHSQNEIAQVLDKLATREIRILRPVAARSDTLPPRFEIFHDVLAAAILDWRSRYEAGKRLERERAEAQRLAREEAERRARVIQRYFTIGLAVLLLIALGLALFAFQQKQVAIDQSSIARQASAESFSRELAAKAVEQSQVDPELSILLAIEAAKITPTQESANALRQALVNFYPFSVLRGHAGRVYSAEYSPDGSRVVTAGSDRTARVWDVQTGRSLFTLGEQTDIVHYAAFSPDGARIVTAGYDKTAQIWDAREGRRLATLTGHAAIVNTAVYSPDGKLILTASADTTARTWDAATGDVVKEFIGHGASVNTAFFSPDGALVLTASDDGSAMLWDAKTATEIRTLSGHLSQVIGATFNHDGKKIVTASVDSTARIWDAATGKELRRFQGHTDSVYSAAFSPDDRTIATASVDQTARVWDADTANTLAVLRGHTGVVRTVAFGIDNQTLLTASYDGTARRWQLNGGYEGGVLRESLGPLSQAIFSADGKQIFTGTPSGTVRAWDAATGAAGQVLINSSGGVQDLRDSPDGKNLLVVIGNTVSIHNLVAGQTQILGSTPANAARFSQDGKFIVTGNADGTAKIWDMAGKSILTLVGHTAPVTSAAYSPDGKRIGTGSLDQTVRIWDAATGKSIATIQVAARVYDVAYSPDGKLIAIAAENGTALVADAANGAIRLSLAGHVGPVQTVAFSPDSRTFLTSGSDRTARLWDAATGREEGVLRGHSAGVRSAAYSPSGDRVVTASYDGTARVYVTGTADLLALARQRVTRILSCEERRIYLHEELVCPTPTPSPQR